MGHAMALSSRLRHWNLSELNFCLFDKDAVPFASQRYTLEIHAGPAHRLRPCVNGLECGYMAEKKNKKITYRKVDPQWQTEMWKENNIYITNSQNLQTIIGKI